MVKLMVKIFPYSKSWVAKDVLLKRKFSFAVVTLNYSLRQLRSEIWKPKIDDNITFSIGTIDMVRFKCTTGQ